MNKPNKSYVSRKIACIILALTLITPFSHPVSPISQLAEVTPRPTTQQQPIPSTTSKSKHNSQTPPHASRRTRHKTAHKNKTRHITPLDIHNMPLEEYVAYLNSEAARLQNIWTEWTSLPTDKKKQLYPQKVLMAQKVVDKTNPIPSRQVQKTTIKTNEQFKELQAKTNAWRTFNARITRESTRPEKHHDVVTSEISELSEPTPTENTLPYVIIPD